MMGHDDIAVGVGGEGGILKDGTILPNVVYVCQGVTTTGGCRYRQAIPVGIGGRLNVDTNFGIRKAFLPQYLASVLLLLLGVSNIGVPSLLTQNGHHFLHG
ncbi:nucleoside hydrolase 5-like [Humulus lupulus]|uniref:nucleoside hydrolase 5-like n=1 Tax=Humulus lupulus TaxID=3486 RepID=UPI002B40DD51|nr:nucleoside hydrolase 5-like [Humulus lupulus]